MEIYIFYPIYVPYISFKIDGIVWKSNKYVYINEIKECFKIDGIVWK